MRSFQGLFDQNLTFLRERYNSVSRVLDRVEKPLSELSYDANGNIDNVILGDVNLYGKNVDEYCSFQVEEYLENPVRIAFRDPGHCNISNVSFGLFRHMREFVEEKSKAGQVLSGLPVVDVGFFFCFGLGLGRHLKKLLQEIKCKHFLIIETMDELFYQSLYAVDWQELYEIALENEIQLHFIVGSGLNDAVRRAESFVVTTGIEFIEGSYYYVHYPSWDNEQGVSMLKERLDSNAVSAGFYEDELNMSRNAYLNIKSTDFRLLKNKPVLKQDYPVFVVASGPSLNDTMHFVKKWRDRVIVVSCGTTLRILLKNGIRPDIHVETENVPVTLEIISKIDEEFGLEDIILAASVTVYPGVAQRFSEVWYYQRPALSSTYLFGRLEEALDMPGPLVANSAVAVATHLGFRNIYLFGVDCGKQKTASTHHKDSLYHDQLGKELGFKEDRLDKYYDRLVPGNFGGEVVSGYFHDMSRINISNLQGMYLLNLYNCSNGARIDRAQPLSAAAVKLSSPEGKQKVVLEQVRKQLRAYGAGEMLDMERLEKWHKGVAVFQEKFLNYLEESIKDEVSFIEIHSAISRFRYDNKEDLDGLFSVIGSTIVSMNRLQAYLGTRIEDDVLRREFVEYTLPKFNDICNWMADNVSTFFAEMLSLKDDIIMPEPYEGGIEEHRK